MSLNQEEKDRIVEEERLRMRTRSWFIFSLLVVVCLLVGAAWLGFQWYKDYSQKQEKLAGDRRLWAATRFPRIKEEVKFSDKFKIGKKLLSRSKDLLYEKHGQEFWWASMYFLNSKERDEWIAQGKAFMACSDPGRIWVLDLVNKPIDPSEEFLVYPYKIKCEDTHNVYVEGWVRSDLLERPFIDR